jgi:hypothetical protein
LSPRTPVPPIDPVVSAIPLTLYVTGRDVKLTGSSGRTPSLRTKIESALADMLGVVSAVPEIRSGSGITGSTILGLAGD